jgi:hypothetical protein
VRGRETIDGDDLHTAARERGGCRASMDAET